MRSTIRPVVVAALIVFTATAANAACQSSGSFSGWLKRFKAEAASQGVSRRTINAALNGVTYDKRVIAYDRKQTVFTQSFLKFSGRMINKSRLSRGRAMIKKHASTFRRIKKLNTNFIPAV